MRLNIVTKKCIESATASVVMMVGALAEGGVNPTPIHPPKPIANVILGIIIRITMAVA
jgi:hypothetical protein